MLMTDVAAPNSNTEHLMMLGAGTVFPAEFKRGVAEKNFAREKAQKSRKWEPKSRPQMARQTRMDIKAFSLRASLPLWFIQQFMRTKATKVRINRA
jgi:hypothetical protein